VARRYLQVALIAGLAVLISAPAVLARGSDCTRCPSRAAQLAQGDPRDPFGRDGTTDDSGSGADSGTSAGGGATTSGSGVATPGRCRSPGPPPRCWRSWPGCCWRAGSRCGPPGTGPGMRATGRDTRA